jgi:hypothetical protein
MIANLAGLEPCLDHDVARGHTWRVGTQAAMSVPEPVRHIHCEPSSDCGGGVMKELQRISFLVLTVLMAATPVGPSLLVSLKTRTKEEFRAALLNGRVEKGMPAYSSSQLATENWEGLYAYLKGRSDGRIQAGRLSGLNNN